MSARVSRFNQYQGYSRASYNGYARRSDYLTCSDGTRLAYDLLLPTRKGTLPAEPLPVLFMYTPYLRAVKLVDSGKVLLDELSPLRWGAKMALRLRAMFGEDGHVGDMLFRERWLKKLVTHGYAVVVVEQSGTGASSGIISASFDEVAGEADEVLTWIAAQPWCDGKIGMFGTSAAAMTQYAAASAGNPHLKAIMPCASGFDMYGSVIYPGGAYCTSFTDVLSRSTGLLEKMIVPVDSDVDGTQLLAILNERGERAMSHVAARFFSHVAFRDSKSPHPRGDKLWEDQGLYNLLDRINDSGVAVYNSVGWFDLFSRDGFRWHVNLTTPHRLHARPLFHNRMGRFQVDLDYAAEVHRWFDYWLKGIDNGVMDEPPVYYHVMGVKDSSVWRTARRWPLPEQKARCFFLAGSSSSGIPSLNDGALQLRRPVDPEAFDAYTIDCSTTSGTDARWSAVLKDGGYRAPSVSDGERLNYATPPLDSDVEITGHPVVHLWIATQAPDVDIFARLQEVPPDGRAWYVTEGNLRASHRQLNAPPFDNMGLPYHRSYEEDVSPIPSGEPVELVFDLLPTSKVFRRGNRILLTITGADADNFETPVLNPPPEIRLLRNASYASYIELPIIPPR